MPAIIPNYNVALHYLMVKVQGWLSLLIDHDCETAAYLLEFGNSKQEEGEVELGARLLNDRNWNRLEHDWIILRASDASSVPIRRIRNGLQGTSLAQCQTTDIEVGQITKSKLDLDLNWAICDCSVALAADEARGARALQQTMFSGGSTKVDTEFPVQDTPPAHTTT